MSRALTNPLNKVVERIDGRLIKLEKEAKASKMPPFGMQRLSLRESLGRLEQLSSLEREQVLQGWTPGEMRKAIDQLGGPEQFMEFLDRPPQG